LRSSLYAREKKAKAKAILCTKLKSAVTQIQKLIGASCVTTENVASAYCLQLLNYYVMSAIFFQAYQIWSNSCPPQQEK
jgi:hypothetical protein